MLIITKQEALDLLEVGEQELLDLMDSELKYFKFGEEIRFNKKDVVELLVNKVFNSKKAEDEFFVSNNINREFIHIDEFANMLNVKTEEVLKGCQSGEIENVSFNGVYYIKNNYNKHLVSLDNIVFIEKVVELVKTHTKVMVDSKTLLHNKEAIDYCNSLKLTDDPLFVVDGSSRKEFVCSGVIFKEDDKTMCFSKLYRHKEPSSTIAELTAIYDAICYAKEKGYSKINIATDQLYMIKRLNEGKITVNNKENRSGHNKIYKHIYDVINSMDVNFYYAQDGNFSKEYGFAHLLSRSYKNNEVKEFNRKDFEGVGNKPIVLKEVKQRSTSTILPLQILEKLIVSKQALYQNSKEILAAKVASEEVTTKVGKIKPVEEKVEVIVENTQEKARTIEKVEKPLIETVPAKAEVKLVNDVNKVQLVNEPIKKSKNKKDNVIENLSIKVRFKNKYHETNNLEVINFTTGSTKDVSINSDLSIEAVLKYLDGYIKSQKVKGKIDIELENFTSFKSELQVIKMMPNHYFKCKKIYKDLIRQCDLKSDLDFYDVLA